MANGRGACGQNGQETRKGREREREGRIQRREATGVQGVRAKDRYSKGGRGGELATRARARYRMRQKNLTSKRVDGELMAHGDRKLQMQERERVHGASV